VTRRLAGRVRGGDDSHAAEEGARRRVDGGDDRRVHGRVFYGIVAEHDLQSEAVEIAPRVRLGVELARVKDHLE